MRFLCKFTFLKIKKKSCVRAKSANKISIKKLVL